MKHFKHLYIDLYSLNLYCVKCSRDEFQKMTEREFGGVASAKKAEVAADFEIWKKKNQDIGVIWLSPKANNADLVHECFHFVHHFLENRGFYLSDNSEEAYAYLLSFVFKKLSKMIK